MMKIESSPLLRGGRGCVRIHQPGMLEYINWACQYTLLCVSHTPLTPLKRGIYNPNNSYFFIQLN